MIISSDEDTHAPLVIVQRNVFAPTESPLTVLAGSDKIVIVAVPEMTDHAPVPEAGVLAVNVVDVAHMF